MTVITLVSGAGVGFGEGVGVGCFSAGDEVDVDVDFEVEVGVVVTMADFVTVFVVGSGEGDEVDPPSTLTTAYVLARCTRPRGFCAPSRGSPLESVVRERARVR